MKIVECIDCNVIQDLLPSYCDKITSETSNELIERHLKKCKNCKQFLEDMNKEISVEYLEKQEEQEEQINYLKRYRRKIILVVIDTIALILTILIVAYSILLNHTFFVDVNDIDISDARYYKYSNENGTEIDFNVQISHPKYILIIEKEYETVDESGNKTLYTKYSGRFSFEKHALHTAYSFKIEDDIEKVYFEDMKGNLREIWNKNEGSKI